MLTLSQPVVAFPDQDHVAHLQTHIAFMMDPIFGGNPALQTAILPGMVKHMVEHVSMWYVAETYRVVSEAAGVPAERLIDTKNADLLRQFDRMLATAQPMVLGAARTALGNAPVIIQKASQMVQQMQQAQMQMMAQMQGGPQVAAAMQRNQNDMQLGTQKLQQDAALAQARLQQEAQSDQMRAQIDAQKVAGETQNKMAANQLKADELRQAASIEHAQLFSQTARDQAETDIARRQMAADAMLAAHEASSAADQARLQAGLDAEASAAEMRLQEQEMAQTDALNARDNAVRLEIARMASWDRQQAAQQRPKPGDDK